VRRPTCINFVTDDEVRDQLRAVARVEDCSVSVIIRRAVRQFLAQRSKRQRQPEVVE
jgi:predicted transcriptional regulator